jgi:hypothetical protein
MSTVVIHRDLTFEFDGEVYQCQRQGPYGSGDDAYEVYRVRDTAPVGEMFDRLSDIRAYVERAAANGWPLVDGEG